MELQQFRYFLTVAKLEHITKAAAELHIAQPALTQCIKRLETELKVPLFDRKGRNIILNENGKFLQKKILPIVQEIDHIPDEFSKIKQERPIKLNISAGTTLMAEILIKYREKYPDAVFSLLQNKTIDNSDISISTIPYKKGIHPEDVVLDEEIFIAVPTNSNFAKKNTLNLQELCNASFIFFSGSKPFRAVCDRFCDDAGFVPHVAFESDSTQIVRTFIEAGLGIGFWPAFSWGKFNSTKATLIPIASPICRRQLIVHIQEKAQTIKSCKTFYEFMVDYLHKLTSNKT